MTARLVTAALISMVVVCIPAVAVGQKPSVDSLLRRIESLERKNAALEQRVAELEAIVRGERPQIPTTPTIRATGNWRELSNWRQLRLGMSMNEVRALLGQPERVEGGSFTYWYWPGAKVTFWQNKVDGWEEPGR